MYPYLKSREKNISDDYAIRVTQSDLDGTKQIIVLSVSGSMTMQSLVKNKSDQLTDRVQREDSCYTLRYPQINSFRIFPFPFRPTTHSTRAFPRQ